MVKRKIFSALIILSLLACAAVASAQTARGTGTTRVANTPLSSLPASDMVMFVDVQRVINDVMPHALSSSPAKLAEANAEIDRLKTRTGIDLRAFDQIAVGARFIYPSAKMIKLKKVALAHGNFNASGVVAAGRLAASGQYREENYKGTNISIFSLNEQMKWLGLLNMHVSEIAVAPLGANLLAFGDLEVVRAAIDTSKGGVRVGNDLITLATRNANAIMGFGANIPQRVSQNVNIDNEEVARNISSIRQAFGSIGATANGFELNASARTEKPAQAKDLSDTIEGLRQLAPLLISAKLRGDEAKVAQKVLDNLKVTTQGNELQIRMELAHTDIATLMNRFAPKSEE
ncbi:MAG: hypothetical protein WCB68_07925 [Pyrinomonadaceae bacterium]